MALYAYVYRVNDASAFAVPLAVDVDVDPDHGPTFANEFNRVSVKPRLVTNWGAKRCKRG